MSSLSGEVSESAEGARLLSEYTGLNLYRGFKSLPLRHEKRTKRSILRNGPLFLSRYLPLENPYLLSSTPVQFLRFFLYPS